MTEINIISIWRRAGYVAPSITRAILKGTLYLVLEDPPQGPIHLLDQFGQDSWIDRATHPVRVINGIYYLDRYPLIDRSPFKRDSRINFARDQIIPLIFSGEDPGF